MNLTTIESSRTPREELTDEDMDTIRILSTFMSTVLDTDQNTLTVQLQNNQVQQSSLDQCLQHGFEMLQIETSDLLHVLSALKSLLQFGAKWDRSVLFLSQRTPYHIICQCPDDQHEILKLMIKADDGELLDAKDSERITPLLFAVAKGNLECVKNLIRNGGDINYVRDHVTYSKRTTVFMSTPLITAIRVLSHSTNKMSIKREILDFLLESGADIRKQDCEKRTPLMHAVDIYDFKCIEKLVQNGARADDPDQKDFNVFYIMVCVPSLEAFKCLFDSVVDKNATDQKGRSILYFVVCCGNVKAVRYILSHGVTFTNNIPTQYDESDKYELHYDPFIEAIWRYNMDVVKILEENGWQMGKSLHALRSAVVTENAEMVQHFLFKYKYPLNQEYCYWSNYYTTVLADAFRSTAVVTMLMGHGADPNKKSSKKQYVTPLHRAIIGCQVSTVACLIRSGADINCRSFHKVHINLLPFEASVLNNRFYAAEMLLISGCSCGSYSLNIDQNIWSSTQYLLKKWNVQDNNVRSLYQMCRTVILKQLSPAANKKIDELPLPVTIIKFLGIPELDDILDNFKVRN